MPYSPERMVLETLVYIRDLHVRDVEVTGWSPGNAEVSLLGMSLFDLLEAVPLDMVRRYLAYKATERCGEGV